MKTLTDPGHFSSAGAVVSIGIFDGVHRGHRRVLACLKELGLRHNLPTVVLTFDPHPRAFFNPQAAPKLLVSLAERLALLASTGAVDECLVLPFDRRQSQEPVEDFVRQTLVARLRIRALVVGENFACGHGRRGNVQYLQKLGQDYGFDVHPMSLRSEAEAADIPHCSSTETRRLIQNGDVTRAAILMGHPHELVGRVAAGAHARARSGRADIPDEMCAPPAGGYLGAVRRQRPDSSWVAANLQVLEAPCTNRRSVHFVTDQSMGVTAGDPVVLRFLTGARLSLARGTDITAE